MDDLGVPLFLETPIWFFFFPSLQYHDDCETYRACRRHLMRAVPIAGRIGLEGITGSRVCGWLVGFGMFWGRCFCINKLYIYIYTQFILFLWSYQTSYFQYSSHHKRCDSISKYEFQQCSYPESHTWQLNRLLKIYIIKNMHWHVSSAKFKHLSAWNEVTSPIGQSSATFKLKKWGLGGLSCLFTTLWGDFIWQKKLGCLGYIGDHTT